ncbi:helix-turn-helix domain-containing protein [Lapidilactobacillus bayanensis]|uniref:helix-turn-helix domain-containing protein n=1 Tax=Lapidilactobacillus bayanensis TaxID=2485998 RepID=UPI000F772979|nr:helix-turn-helix domain-containing protein [Lapidilactobacillus bayanensis]
MDLTELLNKNDALQVKIFHTVLLNNSQVSAKCLLDELKISNPVLIKAMAGIEQLTHKLDSDVHIHFQQINNESYVVLEKSPRADLSDIYYAYLSESVEYKILCYLFKWQHFTTQKLCRYLVISEASVYRYLTHLNHLLAEFDLKIKNGQLVGNELQVDYFYLELIWNSRPMNEIVAATNEERITRTVIALEQALTTKFSTSTSLYVSLWLAILQKRPNAELTDNIINNGLIQEIRKDPLFDHVQQIYFRFILSEANYGSGAKSIYLYLFLNSAALGDDQHLIFDNGHCWPTPFSKIIKMAEWIVNYVNDNLKVDVNLLPKDFIIHWRIVLTQLLTQIYFFHGYINAVAVDISTSIPTSTEILLEPIIKTMAVAFTPHVFLSPTMRTYTSAILESYIEASREFSDYKLVIGIFTRGGFLTTNYLIEQFKSEFILHHGLTIEIATAQHHYDLLITDTLSVANAFHFKELYTLTGKLNVTDKRIITEILLELAAQ